LHRYGFAASYARNGAVLDVGCGSGAGLSLLAREARTLVAGDYTFSNLRVAKGHYGDRFPLVCFDAGHLPFSDASFDLIVTLESLYYFASGAAAVAEFRRVLRKPGHAVVATVNPAWTGFVPSPMATRYFDSCGLFRMLLEARFEVRIFGAFCDEQGIGTQTRLFVRNVASRLNLIPGTLAGRALLKRIFYGALQPLPAEFGLGAAVPRADVVELDSNIVDREHAILYAVGSTK
jgi:SAM-dependent methyltransferase